jgi:glycolate oxidase
MNEQDKQAILDIVGEAFYTDQLIDMVSYSYDASDHDHRPEAAVWPASSQQVSQILRLANKRLFPVIPRGAGTGLAGAAVPVRGGLVLDMVRMNRILDIRLGDQLVVVQPGVVYADLEKAMAHTDFFFPPDPASSKVCTLGGNAATDAGGLRGAKYGVTSDYVKSLEVVLPDGRIMRTDSRAFSEHGVHDLTRLFVGSEGTLGVITEMTLKVKPRPRAWRTSLAYFPSLRDAGNAVSDITREGIIPSALEILDENTINVLRDHVGMPLGEVAAIILSETDGFTDAEATFQMAKVVEIFNKNGASNVQEAETIQEAENLWKARKSVSGAAAKLRANNVSEDVTVPMSKVPDLLTGISHIVRQNGLPFVIFGHAGDGNLHPKIMFDGHDPGQVEKVRKAVDEIFALTCSLDGTLSGEHGIGVAKAPYMGMEHDPVAMDFMRSLKKLLDPHNILNPGKMCLDP